jgi:flagellar hook assembly protein FlgD
MFKIPSKAENTNIILNVYDLRGNIVRSYPFNNISSGSYQIKWDGKAQNGNAVSSGIYIYSLKSSQFCTYKKMTLLR